MAGECRCVDVMCVWRLQRWRQFCSPCSLHSVASASLLGSRSVSLPLRPSWPCERMQWGQEASPEPGPQEASCAAIWATGTLPASVCWRVKAMWSMEEPPTCGHVGLPAPGRPAPTTAACMSSAHTRGPPGPARFRSTADAQNCE